MSVLGDLIFNLSDFKISFHSFFFFFFSNGFNDKLCVEVMSQYKFPQGDLKDKCEAIQRSKRRGLHVYRRILFANYADKLYRVFIII